MGLAATGSICSLFARRVAFGLCRRSVCTYAKRMRMARHLGFRERRGAHSAGHTRSCPPQPAPATGLGGPHDVRQGIVRRQGGRFSRRPGQGMGMGLGAAYIISRASIARRAPNRIVPPRPLHSVITSTRPSGGIVVSLDSVFVPMLRQLRHAQGRGADSAGQTFLTAAMRHKTRRFWYAQSDSCPC